MRLLFAPRVNRSKPLIGLAFLEALGAGGLVVLEDFLKNFLVVDILCLIVLEKLKNVVASQVAVY